MLRLFKKKKADWLDGYPVYDAPHVGVGRTLSEVQANENLDYLLTNRSERKQALSTLLERFNIDMVGGFSNESPDKLIQELYDWCSAHWSTYRNDNHPRQQWLKSSRRGEDLIYSLAMDVAIVLGDLLIQHRPAYGWGVDVDPDNILMESFRRCVVMAPMVSHNNSAIADVERNRG